MQSQGTGSRSFIGTLKIFLFSREYLNKYWFNLLACNGKPPHPSTHTCLTRLLSLTSEGLVVTGNGKRLQRAGKRRLKAGRGMDRRTSRGQPGGGFPQGPAAVGKLGSYQHHSHLREPLREAQASWGSCYWVVCVQSLLSLIAHDPMDCSPPGSSVHGIS